MPATLMDIEIFRRPTTREEFFSWVRTQDGRYEFDGTQPVAMVGGSLNHHRIAQNLYVALRSRLKDSPCEAFCMDGGVGTVGEAVRYPDCLISRSHGSGDARLAPDVVVVFEVAGATSGRRDRIVKTREYAAVASIRRYVIIERTDVGLTVLQRADESLPWVISTLTSGDVLEIPEVEIALPVDEIYEGIVFVVGEADD